MHKSISVLLRPYRQLFRLTSVTNWTVLAPLTLLAACAGTPPAAPEAPGSLPQARSAEPLAAEVPSLSQEMPVTASQEAASLDKSAALQRWVDNQNRLYRVAAPLMIANTELCKRQARNLVGFTAKNRYSYRVELAGLAHQALGLGERLRVMNVLPGSGAAQAGLQKGDILLAAGIDPVPTGQNAEYAAARLVNSAIRGRNSLRLALLRNGKRSTLDIPLTPACAFTVEFGNADNVNSFADGYRVMVTRGMLDFVQSDTELAYVIAHGFALNIVAPTPRPDIGGTIDRLHVVAPQPIKPGGAPLAPYSPVLDATADKLALYMLVRAGYAIENVPAFWKRLAAQHPDTMQYDFTAQHPSTAYRLSVISEIMKVIKSKQSNALALVP